MDNFTFDVPFYDFTQNGPNDTPKKMEAFFEVEHVNHNGVISNYLPNNKEEDCEEKFYSVSPTEAASGKLRRSISVGNLHLDQTKHEDDVEIVSNRLDKLEIAPNKLQCSRSAMKIKLHGMITRSDVKRLTHTARTVSREALNKIADYKSHNTAKDTHTNKYVSMAEAINLFQQKTPSRFHSQSKTHVSRTMQAGGRLPVTIPHSPALRTKLRVRSVSAMSREEIEIKEMEEAKKHYIKANPVNPKILNGPLPLKSLAVLKKPPTKPQPFNLTEVTKKIASNSPKRLTEFHAKPIPKSVLEPPQPIIKSNLFTVPHTPKFMRRMTVHKSNETVMEVKDKTMEAAKLVVTKPVPFSFEQRDKNLMKKRDQLRSEILKEEQKAREFHAKPIPKKILQSIQVRQNETLPSKHSHINESMCKVGDRSSTFNFKARPATVIHMKAFQPKKEERPLTEIAEFRLNTEQRAKERFEFEERKKQRELERMTAKEEEEYKKIQREQEEMMKQRKEAEIKANPIRRYKEVKPIPTKKLTSPKSPKFLTDKIRNKENSEMH